LVSRGDAGFAARNWELSQVDRKAAEHMKPLRKSA
jgi:hypothetical protein